MLTKEEAIRQHRELWKWIAVETLKQRRIVMKYEYFHDKEHICFDCYCCEYDAYFHQTAATCLLCPIDWNSTAYRNMCEDKSKKNDRKNIYNLWLKTNDYKTAALLAYKISKLPEKEFRFVIGGLILTETQLRDCYNQSPDLVESYNTWEEWIYDLLKNNIMFKVK